MIISTPEIALNGYQVTPFIAFSALLFGVYGIIMNLIILEKKTKIIGSIWTLAALISLLNILLVLGILAAAAVTLPSYLTAFFISMNYSRKFFRLHLDYSFIIKSVSASILISIIIVLANPKGLLSTNVLIGISSTVYLLLILAMKGINRKEIDFFKEIFKLT